MHQDGGYVMVNLKDEKLTKPRKPKDNNITTSDFSGGNETKQTYYQHQKNVSDRLAKNTKRRKGRTPISGNTTHSHMMANAMEMQMNQAVMATNANFYYDGDRTHSYAGTSTTFPDLKKAVPNKDLIEETSDVAGLIPKASPRILQADSTFQKAAL